MVRGMMRPWFIAVGCSWVALFAAAFFYSQQHPAFHWIWTAALPAFALETLFYLSSVLEIPRDAFRSASIPFTAKAALLWASAILPYLVFSLLAGTFQPQSFYLLLALTGVFSFWHVLLPRRMAYDAGFLVVAAAPFLTHVFTRLYRSPDEHMRVDTLGHLMWIRLGVVALLVFREWDAGPVSIWPKLHEWKIGLIWFAAGVIPICATALGLHALKLHAPAGGPWYGWILLPVLYFFAFLFSSTFGEELFFRGLIERALLNARPSPILPIAVSAVAFGSVHLWFGHYPNWSWMAIATVLGVFCGIAYWRAQSIRASMVTHALTIALWKLLFV